MGTSEVLPAPKAAALTRAKGYHPQLTAAKRSFRLHWQLYLLILAPLTYFVIFKYLPISNNIVAFKDYNVVQGVWGSPWVGFAQFRRFFANPMFWNLLRNTILLSGYVVLVSFPLPIVLALGLNEIRLKAFKKTVQMVTYAPYFISTVIVVSMVMLLFSPQVGLMRDVTDALGVEPIDLLSIPGAFRHVYVWSDIWQTCGYSAVIYMAALAGIDPALYEAARVDGASRLRKIWHVDIPGIMPTAFVVLVLAVGNVMAIGFEKAYLLQNPLNLSQSEIIATYTYKVGLLNLDVSQAAAIGLFNSVVNLVLLLVVNSLVKRVSGNGLW